MDESIKSIITALTEAVQNLGDRSTGDGASSNPRNAFDKSQQQERTEQDKSRAEAIVKEQEKARKKSESDKSRSILKQVMPVSIIGLDKGALKALKDIIPDPVDKTKKASEDKEDDGGTDLLKGLAYTAFALIVGPVMALFGFFEEINKQKWFIKLKDFVKSKFWEPIKKFFKPVGDFFTKIKNSKFVKSITTKLDDMWKGIKEFGGRVKKFFKPVTDFIDDTVEAIKKFGGKVKKFFKPFMGMFDTIGSIFGGAEGKPGVFSKIINFFNPAKNPVLKGIMTFAKGVGATLGKLFLPITVIMGIIDGVTGFMKGYEEEGDILGGIEGALVGIINGLIMLPLDLLKDGASWILEKLGMTDASAALDSFSFQEMFAEWFDVIFSNIRQLGDRLFGGFGDVWDSIFGDGDGINWEQLLGGLMTIFTAIPTYILDVLKDGISMVLGWFGVDTSWLDSFDIADLVDETIGWLIDGVMGIVDFFGLLFTEPGKAFDKITKWFSKLFSDPVGTIKDMLPQWMVDFGSWLYDNTIKPIADFFGGVADDPATAKKNMLSYLPEWMTGFAGWVFDTYILPIVNFFDRLLSGDIAGAFSALIPQWMKDFGGWLYDETIGKIMQFFNGVENNSEGMKQNFLAMLPSWMVGFGEWIWDNAIKPIADFFNSLFDDPAGTIKSLIPQWMLDVAGWLYDNALAPIVDWFDTLFDDPLAAFSALIPDWVKDIGGWIGEQLSGVWDGISGIFDPILNFDFTSIVPDWIMDLLDDDQKEALAAAQNKEAEKQVENLAKSGMNVDAAKMVGEARLKARDARGGENLADGAEDYEDRLESMIADGKQLADSHFKAILKGMESGGYGFHSTKLAQEVFAQTGGAFDASNKKHQDILKKQLAKVKADETFGDDINDDYDESLRLLGLASAKADYDIGLHNDTVLATMEALKRSGGLKLGDEHLRFFDKSPVTGTMVAELQKMFSDKSDDKKIIVEALKRLGITPENLEKSTRFQASTDVAQDFIWRPGQEPMKFSKGDIVMGLHQDVKPPETSQNNETTNRMVESSEQLVSRVDKMVQVLSEHSDIHNQILEVLQQSGLMDKQGDTVVNSGGNSTVINNNTIDSDIMGFRDKVVGRLKTMPTK